MNTKKILVYFVSFLSLSLIFTGGYYFSYKKALEEFNKSAEQRSNELIYTLEDRGLLIVEENNYDKKQVAENNSNLNKDGSVADFKGQSDVLNKAVKADNLKETVVLPNTKYILQTYNIDTNEKTDEALKVPNYLVGLNREEVLKYLDTYMEDMPWNEFRDGLSAYELLLFSDKELIIRKTYTPDLVEYEFYITSDNENIVVFYSDQKTVYEYTNMSTRKLSEEKKTELEEGYFIKDLDELYAVLENYTS